MFKIFDIIIIVIDILHLEDKYRSCEVKMAKRTVILLPETMEILETMGEQIKLARLRRRLSAGLVAERAGISRATLCSVEKGAPSVSMGTYAAVLHALNRMEKDLLYIAKDDELGRKLQDLELVTKKRAPKRKRKNEQGE